MEKERNFCDYYIKPFPKIMQHDRILVRMESLKMSMHTKGIAEGTGTILRPRPDGNINRQRYDDWIIEAFTDTGLHLYDLGEN